MQQPVHPWATDPFSWLLTLGRAGKPLVFSSLDDLRPAAGPDKRSYQTIGVRSHVAQPIIIAGELVGFLGFACLRRERTWPEDLIARMRALADIFASALAGTRRSSATVQSASSGWRPASSPRCSLPARPEVAAQGGGAVRARIRELSADRPAP